MVSSAQAALQPQGWVTSTASVVRRVLRMLFQLLYLTAVIAAISALCGQNSVVNLFQVINDANVDRIVEKVCPSSFKLTMTPSGPLRLNQPLPYIVNAGKMRELLPQDMYQALTHSLDPESDSLARTFFDVLGEELEEPPPRYGLQNLDQFEKDWDAAQERKKQRRG